MAGPSSRPPRAAEAAGPAAAPSRATAPTPRAPPGVRNRAASRRARTPVARSSGPAGSGRVALACPICFATVHDGRSGPPPAGAPLECEPCRRVFRGARTAEGAPYWDLTVASSSSSSPSAPPLRNGGGGGFRSGYGAGTTLFQTVFLSRIYERGWRQSFASNGFPGPDAEFEKCLSAVSRRCSAGGPVLDLSCGSGLFTRRFCREFPVVAALDFSEAMLEQTADYLGEEGVEPPVLVRGDAGRLPFPNGSLAVVHAGAAIHCWPDPQAAVAEVSRVLAPGGLFFASTFMYNASPLGELLGDSTVRPLVELERQAQGAIGQGAAFRWWEQSELEDLTEKCGLEGFESERSGRCILFSAIKPGGGGGVGGKGEARAGAGGTGRGPRS